jgi:zinc protease
VLTLVGDFQPTEALAKIKKYFGDIPAQPAPPAPDLAEPKQTAERRKTIEDPFAQVPRVDIAFKTPPGNTNDVYALDVLSTVLGGGQSSPLYQSLVKDKELAVNVFCYIDEHKGPSTFNVTVLVRPGKDLKEVEKVVYAELEKAKSEAIPDWELQKVHMMERHQTAEQLQSTLYRAYIIGEMASIYGDPNLINTRFDKIASVGKDDIQRVAKTYLTEDNRTVVTTLPKPKSDPASKVAN